MEYMTAQVLATVRDMRAQNGVAAPYVTHDLAVVANLATRILVMYAGRIVESGSTEQIFANPAHPYTRRLLAAIPVLSERRDLQGIAGQAPAPGARPSGCAFHPRCPVAVPECALIVPESVVVGEGHEARCIRLAEITGRRMSIGLAPVREIPPAGDALLRVGDLRARHGSNEVLHGVSLAVRLRECVALVGESGSGKTTLARCVTGLHAQQTGTVDFNGIPLARRARDRTVEQRRHIQYVFQSPFNSLNPRRTIGDILRAPVDIFFPTSRSDSGRRVAEALDSVALPARTAAQYPDQLSGGERQRVAIARALIARPTLLICDEITSARDVSVQASIVRLLRDLQEAHGLTLLFVTHNLALVRTIADTVVTLYGGSIVEMGNVESVLQHPEHPYTRELIGNTPTI